MLASFALVVVVVVVNTKACSQSKVTDNSTNLSKNDNETKFPARYIL